jgi:HK97 family phage portal protein
MLPAFVKVRDGEGSRDAVEHPMYEAMHDEPDPEISSQGFREMLTSHAMWTGDAHAKILRRSGTQVAFGLSYLLPGKCTQDREKGGQKRLVYVVHGEYGAADKTYTVEPGKPHDIFHLRGISWNGAQGLNTLQYARQSIGTALAAERSVGQFWKMGGRVPYHIETDRLDGGFSNDAEFDLFRDDWRKRYSVPHEAPILPNGMKLVKDGMSMADAQTLQTREWTVSELARWTGASPHLLADLSHGTFSNVEHLFLEFKTVTLPLWTRRWEQDFRRCVYTPEEKAKGFMLKHNLNAFLMGDFKTRMEGYASALQNGHMNIDDVMAFEDRNPLPNKAGKTHHIQLNMGTVPGTGKPTVTEQAILARIEKDKAAAKAPAPVAAPSTGEEDSEESKSLREVQATIDDIQKLLDR